MEIKVNEDIGLTYVIKQQLIADGEDTSNLNKFSVWSQILELCDEQNTENKNNNEESLYDGGNDKTRSGWGNSYKVYVGKVLKFSDDIWNKIKELAAGGDDETISASQGQNSSSTSSSTSSSSNNTTRRFNATDIKVTVPNNPTIYDEDGIDNDIIKYKNACNGNLPTESTPELLKPPIQTAIEILEEYQPWQLAYFLDKCPNAVDLLCGNSMISQQAATEDVYKYIMLPLAERADKLGIKLTTTAVRDAELRKNNLNAMKNQISYLKDWIIKKEKQLVQKDFDKANSILIKCANLETIPECVEKVDNDLRLTLNDKTIIEIIRDSSHNISEIHIFIEGDLGQKVTYDTNEAWANITNYTGFSIYTGYDFEKIKTVAEHIVENLS